MMLLQTVGDVPCRVSYSPGSAWTAYDFVFPPVEDAKFLATVSKVTAWRKSVEPWLLEDVAPNPAFVVATHRSWPNRLRVWWLNVGRRAKARKLAERISDAEVERRRQVILGMALDMSLQQNNPTDAPRA